MASRSLCGGAVATGAVVCMQPDRVSADIAAMIGSRNARATRTGAIPSHETTLDLHPLWLTNRFCLWPRAGRQQEATQSGGDTCADRARHPGSAKPAIAGRILGQILLMIIFGEVEFA